MLSLNRFILSCLIHGDLRWSSARRSADTIEFRCGGDPRGDRCRASRRLEPRLCRCRRDQGSVAAQNAALDRLRQPRRPGPLCRYRRFHRKEPGLAAPKGVAHACRRSAGRRNRCGRRRLVCALSAGQRYRTGPRRRDQAEFGRCRGRHRGIARGLGRQRFQRARRKELSRQSCRGDYARKTTKTGSTGCCGKARIEAARRMLSRVPPDYRALAEARLALVVACSGRRSARRARSGCFAGRFRSAL